MSTSVVVWAQQLNENIPDEITIEHHNLFPEGIEFDEAGERFLISSMESGTIHQFDDEGTLTTFVEDNDLHSTAGLEIDRNNNRLLVANTNFDNFGQAWLGAYDLETGQRLFMSNLSDVFPADMHLANDVAVDSEGNAYVTDTFAPAIYRVDMDGGVSVFLQDDALAFTNGIVAHPDGYLLLGAFQNQLLKISLDEPTVMPVALADSIQFDVIDGMVLHPDGSLIVVTFPGSIIYRLTSDDDWTSANLIGLSTDHEAGWGTTVALRGESVYVVHSHLNDWEENLDQDSFEIVRVFFQGDQASR